MAREPARPVPPAVPEGTSLSTSTRQTGSRPRSAGLRSPVAQPVRHRRQRQSPGGTEAARCSPPRRPGPAPSSAISATSRVLPDAGVATDQHQAAVARAAPPHRSRSRVRGPGRRVSRRPASPGRSIGGRRRRVGVAGQQALQGPRVARVRGEAEFASPGPKRSGGRCSLLRPGHRDPPAASSTPVADLLQRPQLDSPAGRLDRRREVTGPRPAVDSRSHSPRTGARVLRASSSQSSYIPGRKSPRYRARAAPAC